jgi:formylglycine-generating enzyme
MRYFVNMFLLVACFIATSTFAAEPNTLENSLGMKLTLVPAGEFEMGSEEKPESLAKSFPNLEASRFDLPDEAPLHKVHITKPFYFGTYEVTRAQFQKYLELSGNKPEAETDGTGGWGFDPKKKEFVGRKPEFSWKNPGFEQENDHPVINVTWGDSVKFCEWLSAKEGVKYRLPTEAEWEYACRAGTKTRYYSGHEPESLLKVANTFDKETGTVFTQWEQFAVKGSDGYKFTSPVGKFAPNAFGLYDMHGGVWEWCNDWYGEDYYAKSPTDDPQGPATGKVKVRRGGSWHTWPIYVRASFRNWNTPVTRYVLVGIRVVREVK